MTKDLLTCSPADFEDSQEHQGDPTSRAEASRTPSHFADNYSALRLGDPGNRDGLAVALAAPRYDVSGLLSIQRIL